MDLTCWRSEFGRPSAEKWFNAESEGWANPGKNDKEGRSLFQDLRPPRVDGQKLD